MGRHKRVGGNATACGRAATEVQGADRGGGVAHGEDMTAAIGRAVAQKKASAGSDSTRPNAEIHR